MKEDLPASVSRSVEPAPESRYVGTLLGAALGDAYGAPWEGGPIERFLWLMIGRTLRGERRWTDDTQMALDLAESIVRNEGRIVQVDLARRFAESYRWSRGYGPAAARVLARIRRGAAWDEANRSVYSEGSFGNGGAMRAYVVALIEPHDLAAVARAARDSAMVTHAHELAQDGAVLIASATALAVTGRQPRFVFEHLIDCDVAGIFREKLRTTASWLQEEQLRSPAQIVEVLGNGVAATESVPLALYAAARFADRPFRELLLFLRSCGGDVDTTGAMAGAVFGAANGVSRLPSALLARLEERPRIEETARALHALSRRLHPRSESVVEREGESFRSH